MGLRKGWHIKRRPKLCTFAEEENSGFKKNIVCLLLTQMGFPEEIETLLNGLCSVVHQLLIKIPFLLDSRICLLE